MLKNQNQFVVFKGQTELDAVQISSEENSEEIAGLIEQGKGKYTNKLLKRVHRQKFYVPAKLKMPT